MTPLALSASVDRTAHKRMSAGDRPRHSSMLECWPMTSLLDVFKDADLRIRLTDVFRSATAWENLDRENVQEHLLLALYGLSSNAGMKRMSAGRQRTNYKDLLYMRRRYTHLLVVCEDASNFSKWAFAKSG
jgi:hypothetical protein